MDNHHYILPVTINGRRIHYLDISGDAPDEAAREPFIAALQRGRTLLFSIDKQQKAKTLARGTRDIDLSHCVFSANVAGNTLTIVVEEAGNVKPDIRVAVAPDDDDDGDYLAQPKHTNQQQAKAAPLIETDSAYTPAISGLYFEWENTGNAISVYACLNKLPDQEWKAPVHMECRLQLQVGYREAEGGFLMQFAHPLQVIEGGLDFGSESSQIIQRTTDKGGQLYASNDRTPDLFEKIKNYYERKTGAPLVSAGNTNIPAFIQQEPGTKFYKSVFFLKKQLNFQSPVHQFANHLPKGDDENLKMITPNTSGDVATILKEYRQLPNPKLARKYRDLLEVYDYNFRVSDGYDTISQPLDELLTPAMGSILEIMITAWISALLERAVSPRFVRFTLLVPNIYDEKDVSITISTLHGIMQRLQDNYGKEKFGGWEVQIISESDASFLGFQRVTRMTAAADKYFLVIDCGKGTTDFSIISCTGSQGNEKLTPIYRDGFAGAGNLITYAFFETVIAYLMENAENDDQMAAFVARFLTTEMKNTPGGDPYYLNEIALKLESLKKNYDPGKDMRQIYNEWENTADDNGAAGGVAYHLENRGYLLEPFVSLLKKQESIGDWNGYIAAACKDIAGAVASRIAPVAEALRAQKLEPGGVLLTGRGFLFKPLADEISRQLTETLSAGSAKPLKIEQPLTAAEYKDVCLKGLLNSPFVLDTQMIGWPMPLRTRKAESVAVPEQRNGIISRIARFISSGSIASTNALKNKLPSLLEHDLLINNQRWWPSKRNQWGSEVANCDLLFLPQGKFCVRQFDKDSYLMDESDLSAETQNNPFTRELLVPSLFPVVIDKDEIQKRIREIKKVQP